MATSFNNAARGRECCRLCSVTTALLILTWRILPYCVLSYRQTYPLSLLLSCLIWAMLDVIAATVLTGYYFLMAASVAGLVFLVMVCSSPPLAALINMLVEAYSVDALVAPLQTTVYCLADPLSGAYGLQPESRPR